MQANNNVSTIMSSSSNLVVVGMPYEDNGKVLIFKRRGSDLILTHLLTDLSVSNLGLTVAFSNHNDILKVTGIDIDSKKDIELSYIFDRVDNSWTLKNSKILPKVKINVINNTHESKLLPNNFHLSVRELMDQKRVIFGNINKSTFKDITVCHLKTNRKPVSMTMCENDSILVVTTDKTKQGLFLDIYDDINQLSCQHHYEGII